jgi:hypothetical protein
VAPEVVIAGAAKCGTTSLAVAFNRHPDLDVGRFKEPHFFADFEPAFAGPLGREFNDSLITDMDAYVANFRNAGGVRTVDASSGYLSRPRSAEAIAKSNPDARIIIAIRNPVDRAWSAYKHLLRKGVDPGSFDEALRSERERLLAGWIPLFGLVTGSRYAPGIEAFLTQFGAEQVYILRHGRYRAEPERTLRELSEFLGLSSPILPAGDHNVGGAPRSRLVDDVMRSQRGLKRAARRSLGRALPRRAKQQVRSAVDQLNRGRNERPSAAAREWILSRLADDMEQTSALTGFDLSGWSAAPA